MVGRSPLLEVAQKPAVLVSVLGQVPEVLVNALENGLEEEGIPCEIHTATTQNPVLAANRMAKDSRINVGLAIAGQDPGRSPGAVLHHRDLPEDRPLFCLAGADLTVDALLRLGQNAARLVKGNPFILDGPGNTGTGSNDPGAVRSRITL